jgi:hypothetical protein
MDGEFVDSWTGILLSSVPIVGGSATPDASRRYDGRGALTIRSSKNVSEPFVPAVTGYTR